MTGDFTRDELAMLYRHAMQLASATAYQLKQHEGQQRTIHRKRRVETLERRLAVAESAAAKLQALIDAGPGFPGLARAE